MRIIEKGDNPDLEEVECRHCKSVVEVNMVSDHPRAERRTTIDAYHDVFGPGQPLIRTEIVEDIQFVTCPVCQHDLIVESKRISEREIN